MTARAATPAPRPRPSRARGALATTGAMSGFESSSHVLAPRQARSRQALVRIVEAAERVLRRDGLDGFSMNAVAAAAGLPVGNLYRRFKGKAELLQALKEDLTNRVETALLSRLAACRFSSLETFVPEFIAVTADVFASDEAVHQILFDARVLDSSLHDIGHRGRARIFGYYREALVPLLAAGDPARAELRARVSFQMAAGAVVGKASGHEPLLADLPWPVLQAELATAVLSYLRSDPNAS